MEFSFQPAAGGRAERLKWIGGRAVWSNLIIFISAVGWNENFISAAGWNGMKWICPTKRWIYGRASRPIHHTNTIQIHVVEPAEPVRLAHTRTRARRRVASWNGIFISANSGIFISAQSWNENSIKILVAQRDHFPFHLRASVELQPSWNEKY